VGTQHLRRRGQAGVHGPLRADQQHVGLAGGEAGQQRLRVAHHLDAADERQGDEARGDVVTHATTLVVHPHGRGAVTRPTHPVVDHACSSVFRSSRSAGGTAKRRSPDLVVRHDR
jgi:hypothetical protein